MVSITNDLHGKLFRQFDGQLSQELGDQLSNQFDLRRYQEFDNFDVQFYWPLYNKINTQLSRPLYWRLCEQLDFQLLHLLEHD